MRATTAGDLVIAYFNARREYLEKLLPVGARRYVSGTVALYDGMLQMVHPDRVVAESELATLPLIEPVYPLTEGLTVNQVRRAIEAALPNLPALPEWQDAAWLAQSGLPAFADALRRCTARPSPATSPAGSPPGRGSPMTSCSPASSRSCWCARICGGRAGARTAGDGRLARAHRRRPALPRSRPRRRAPLAEIVGDLARPERMLRLLQGDVGSGKTVVALLACRRRDRGRPPGGADGADRDPRAPASRRRSRRWPRRPGMRVAILTGREQGRERADDARPAGRRATIDLVVGTHALFQEEVAFRDLALAVVDEQHRFGVHQRLALAQKGDAPSTCW